MLHGGQRDGAAAEPKYDAIHHFLKSAKSWTFGAAGEAPAQYDPIGQLFAAAAAAPSERSKYDPLQVCILLARRPV